MYSLIHYFDKWKWESRSFHCITLLYFNMTIFLDLCFVRVVWLHLMKPFCQPSSSTGKEAQKNRKRQITEAIKLKRSTSRGLPPCLFGWNYSLSEPELVSKHSRSLFSYASLSLSLVDMTLSVSVVQYSDTIRIKSESSRWDDAYLGWMWSRKRL